MRTRTLVAIAVTAGALAVPHAAGAADLYVQSGAGAATCAQDDPCSLQQAITIADIVSNQDTIHVTGPLTHSGAVDLSNSPIDLIGSGRDAGGTAIDAGSGGLHVGADSSVRAVVVSSTAGFAVTLEGGGRIGNARIDAAAQGIDAQGGTVRATAIGDVDVAAANVAIRVVGIVGGEYTTIRDSHVSAGMIGVSDQSGAATASAFHLERSTVEANDTAIVVNAGRATIANSLIRATAPGGDGVGVRNTGELTVDGSTLVGSGPGSHGVTVGPSTHTTVTGSIVRGFGEDLRADVGPLMVSYSDYATTNGAGVADLGGNVHADPHWVDPTSGDYRLAADSPLIDKGTTAPIAPGETDRGGAARLTDGDGDGTPARDIGAFEYQRPPPPTPPSTQNPADPPSTTDAPAGPTGQQPVTTPPQPPAQPQATALSVAVGKLVLNRRGRGTVRVNCSAKPCVVKLRLTTTGKRPHTLARASGPAGKLSVQLSRSARTYVKKHRIRKVALTAIATDTTGRRASVRRIVRLP